MDILPINAAFAAGMVAAALTLAFTGAVHAAPAPAPGGGPRRELNLVPLVGGDSDVGVGFGQVSDWASLAPTCQPFCWRLETAAFISFKVRDGGIVVPFQDYAVMYNVPQLGQGGRWRFDLRAAFTDETTLRFFGIGNATPEPPPGTPLSDVEYRRIHPTVTAMARAALIKNWFVEGGMQYTRNWLTWTPTSLVARTQAGPSSAAALLPGDAAAPHSVGLLELGAIYDSRDNEIVTRRGMFHKLRLRVSPRVGAWAPYGYQQVNAAARFYFTPGAHGLTISWRLVGDVLLGAPPFYELARFDETAAIGGVNGVRGVPAQRYYGKVKLFQNLEARADLLPFSLWRKKMILGAALFVDGGRLWSELGQRHADLDGTGWGIKYGVGGGLRLQEGQTFVVRADIAWSPDARPVGAYFAAGEIF